VDHEQAVNAIKAIQSDPEIARIDEAIDAERAAGVADSETIAAIGGRYPVGESSIGAVRPGALVALALISSPLLGRPGDIADADVWRALYAIEGGPDTMTPVMGLDMRLRAARQLSDEAQGSPELFAVYLSHLDSIQADAWLAFDNAAIEFCKQYGHITAGEALGVVAVAIQDAMASSQMIKSNPSKKKEEPADSKSQPTTPTGSRSLRRSVLNLAESILGRLRGALVSPN